MSVRDDILENIVDTLSTLPDIHEARKDRLQWVDWGGNERWPKACIYTDAEDSRPRIGCNIYDHYWRIAIRVFYKGENAQEVVDGLLNDVRNAMLQSTSLTRGGHAIDTDYNGTAIIEDQFEESRNMASHILNFTVHYREVYD